MVKIFIDAGHGGHDGGAIANGLKEKDLTLEIAKKLRSELNKYRNVQVKMSRTGDTFLSLSRRANIANSWGADLFLSIHINAGGGVGYEDYIHTSQNSKTKSGKIQSCINAEMIKATGWRNRGRKRANFAVLRQTKMPAILTENGFIDTKTDADKLKSNSFLNKIADGHAKGIAKHFGLKKKKGSSSSTKKTSNKKKSTSKTVSRMADEVIAGKHGSGHYNRRKSLGISKSEYEKVRKKVNEKLGVKTKSPKSKSKKKTFKVGQRVTLKKSATRFATGERIADFTKGKRYKIIQVKSNRVLLDGIMSWVYKKDVQ